jgi:hypothetical protein
MSGESILNGFEIGGHHPKKLLIELVDNGKCYDAMIHNPNHLIEGNSEPGDTYFYTDEDIHRARVMLGRFLPKRNRKAKRLKVWTEMGPYELVQKLKDDLGIDYNPNFCLEHVIAPFQASYEQIQRLREELEKNPNKYFISEQKKLFG